VARPSTQVAHADDGFGYETMFLLQPHAGAALDVDAIRRSLEAIGESVLVAGDHRAVKVHVHSERPHDVLALGLSLGTLSRISVENLDNQTRDVRERRASEFTGPAATPTPTPTATAPIAVIAVAAGDGLAAIFESFGCSAVVRGGQSANPSTGELIRAVEATNAADILLLPNNPNVLLAARQVAAMTQRRVAVIPTRNAAEGLAALLALDPAATAEENTREMTAAGRAIQSLEVTEAVRDAEIGGRRVKEGHTIVLDPDDGLVAVDGDTANAVLAGMAKLNPGYELITVYYGEGADLASTEALARRIRECHAPAEVEIVRGGQPFYRYLIAAE
jgi:dihydroxyacetone kinase-like predicted kinase